MDLMDLMQPLAILSVLVAGYILVFRKPPSQRKNGHYTLPGIVADFLKKNILSFAIWMN